MAILKYSYLSLGVILYVLMNIVSYTLPTFSGPLEMKILFSLMSLVLLLIDYILILWTEKILKRPFKDFTTYVKVSLYVGIVIIPLISLYYT